MHGYYSGVILAFLYVLNISKESYIHEISVLLCESMPQYFNVYSISKGKYKWNSRWMRFIVRLHTFEYSSHTFYYSTMYSTSRKCHIYIRNFYFAVWLYKLNLSLYKYFIRLMWM